MESIDNHEIDNTLENDKPNLSLLNRGRRALGGSVLIAAGIYLGTLSDLHDSASLFGVLSGAGIVGGLAALTTAVRGRQMTSPNSEQQ
ncbi:MAG TPA: hypothetical protein VNE40_01325 [Candidatus Dormibacteraeota bacterium]|nr:hypothetical protein [Candidatus Dormibacteraeota bacterium]